MIKPNQLHAHNNDATKRGGDSGRGKPWLALLIIVMLAGVVGWFWLARDPESREELAQHVKNLGVMTESVTSTFHDMASSVQSITAALKNRLIGQPPVPETGTSGGSTLPGAPPKSHSPIETPEDLEKALAEQGPALEGGASERGVIAKAEGLLPPVGRTDDAVVRVAFLDDLAAWLVKNYTPPSAHGRAGQVSASLQSANLRYGVGMKGLAWIGEDLSAGRSAALAYVYTPAMLDALYRLYINRFMDAVTRTLDNPGEKALSPVQKEAFYSAYAKRFRSLSGALQGVAALPDFSRHMDELKHAAQRVVDANAQYSELVFAHDAAREQGATAKAETLRQRMDTASQTYRQAVIAREQSREALAQLIKKNPTAHGLDDESLLYVASWVERRVRTAPDKMDATLQAATLFLDLAHHFEAAKQTLQTGAPPAATVQPPSGQLIPPSGHAAPPSGHAAPAALPGQPAAAPTSAPSHPGVSQGTAQPDAHAVRLPMAPPAGQKR